MTNSKLNLAQVGEIRERLGRGEARAEIAADYDVTVKAIDDIKAGRTWRPPGCPVTIYANSLDANPHRCREPLALGAPFCLKHESDRRRLGDAPRPRREAMREAVQRGMEKRETGR